MMKLIKKTDQKRQSDSLVLSLSSTSASLFTLKNVNVFKSWVKLYGNQIGLIWVPIWGLQRSKSGVLHEQIGLWLWEGFTHSRWASALSAASPRGITPFLDPDNEQECNSIRIQHCKTVHRLCSLHPDLCSWIGRSICPLQHLLV